MSKTKEPTEAELKELYDENFFYEYGDNPANKKYLQYMQANLKDGGIPDYRSILVDNRSRWLLTRDFEDFFQRDCKLYTFPRSLAAFISASMLTYSAFGYTMKMLPYGKNGITSFKQTQLYRQFGSIPCRLLLAFPFAVTYAWYKLANFTGRKFWNHVILGERNWELEYVKNTPVAGDYYFKDSPLSCEDSFPDLARGEMGRSIADRPSWVSD